MNELMDKGEVNIENMIYNIRGKQVMLDSDLAQLYHCSNGTKSINLAVKRHINRFPERFMFQLTEEESRAVRFQFETKNGKVETRGGKFDKPFVFTEQGVSMLSAILRTDVAEKISIRIMDAFVAMRHYIGSGLLEQEYINNLVMEDNQKIKENTNDIKLLQKAFATFKDKDLENELYFNGKRYDAYSKVLDIFRESKEELIIIDRYTDKTMLDMIKNLTCKVILITGSNTKLTELDIKKYNETYDNLRIVYNDTYHDRYFIIDKNKIYHSGNSINHIGYRKSSINVLRDDKVKKAVFEDLLKII